MDVFHLRDQVVDEYQQYVKGFIPVREPRLKRFVDEYFESQKLWPEPFVQLNPAFEQGRTVDQLVASGLLRDECRRMFRRREHEGDVGSTITLHKHQDDALQAANSRKSYVL